MHGVEATGEHPELLPQELGVVEVADRGSVVVERADRHQGVVVDGRNRPGVFQDGVAEVAFGAQREEASGNQAHAHEVEVEAQVHRRAHLGCPVRSAVGDALEHRGEAQIRADSLCGEALTHASPVARQRGARPQVAAVVDQRQDAVRVGVVVDRALPDGVPSRQTLIVRARIGGLTRGGGRD